MPPGMVAIARGMKGWPYVLNGRRNANGKWTGISAIVSRGCLRNTESPALRFDHRHIRHRAIPEIKPQHFRFGWCGWSLSPASLPAPTPRVATRLLRRLFRVGAPFAERQLWNVRAFPASVRLDASELAHLAPLLGFVGNQPAEVT